MAQPHQIVAFQDVQDGCQGSAAVGRRRRVDEEVAVRHHHRSLIPDPVSGQVLRGDPALVSLQIRGHGPGHLTQVEILGSVSGKPLQGAAVVGVAEAVAGIAGGTVRSQVDPAGLGGDCQFFLQRGGFVVVGLVPPAGGHGGADLPALLCQLDGGLQQFGPGPAAPAVVDGLQAADGSRGANRPVAVFIDSVLKLESPTARVGADHQRLPHLGSNPGAGQGGSVQDGEGLGRPAQPAVEQQVASHSAGMGIHQELYPGAGKGGIESVASCRQHFGALFNRFRLRGHDHSGHFTPREPS